jgi:MFS family permease
VGLINFIGVPSSIIGNEIAQRQGRKKWINYAMLLSFMSALMFSLAYEQSWWVILGLAFLHMIFIMADSSTLTAGLVMSAQHEIKGAAMGLHSLVGFMGGLAGPALFGYVLDIAHKMNLENPWTYAYGSIVIASLVFVFFNWKNNEIHRAIVAFDR